MSCYPNGIPFNEGYAVFRPERGRPCPQGEFEYERAAWEIRCMRDDWHYEQGIPLKEVPNRMPRRNGKKLHPSTIYRWATKGARGRVLETTLIGGIRYTTREALERFLNGSYSGATSSELSAIDDVLSRDGI